MEIFFYFVPLAFLGDESNIGFVDSATESLIMGTFWALFFGQFWRSYEDYNVYPIVFFSFEIK